MVAPAVDPAGQARASCPASAARSCAAGVGAVGRGEAGALGVTWPAMVEPGAPTRFDDAVQLPRPRDPADADVDRLRAWYEDVLGFTPLAVRPGAVLYETTPGSVFAISRGSVPVVGHAHPDGVHGRRHRGRGRRPRGARRRVRVVRDPEDGRWRSRRSGRAGRRGSRIRTGTCWRSCSSTIRSDRSETSTGGQSATSAAIASRCSGVLPQQPPMIDAPASRIAQRGGGHRRRLGAVDRPHVDELGHARVRLGDEDRVGVGGAHPLDDRDQLVGSVAAVAADRVGAPRAERRDGLLRARRPSSCGRACRRSSS